MAYAADFEHDIFISYARGSDAEENPETHGWVTEFFRALEGALKVRIAQPEKLRVFFDRRSLGANFMLDEILAAARSSAVFVAITSTAYVSRDWPLKELAAFGAAAAKGPPRAAPEAQPSRRLFAVEYLPLDDGENYPELLAHHNRPAFWKLDDPHSSVSLPMMPGVDPEFRARIHRLAAEIKNTLVALNRKPAAVAAPVVQQPAEGTVFLAQCTDDLEDEHAQVRSHLTQYGYRVLPDGDHPQGGDAFIEAVANDLGHADLFVQLLGPRAGRRPSDLPQGHVRAQFDLATEAGKPMMLWRRPDMDLSAIADAEHALLLNDANVIASGLASFKSDIHQRLQSRKQGGDLLPPNLIFVNADQSDVEAAKDMKRKLEARKLTTFVPMFEGSTEKRQSDLDNLITHCDVVIFVYGNAELDWLRAQAMRFNKLRPNDELRAKLLLVGPPDEKPGDIGFYMRGLKRVECSGDWPVEPILDVIGKPH